jgi:hypothetical protein
MSKAQEICQQYVGKFTTTFGIDYIDCEDRYLNVAGAAGIYPDVGYLLFAVTAACSGGVILEFGSGLSTVVLARAAERSGAALFTLESDPKWAEVVRCVLATYGIVPAVFCGREQESFVPTPVDFLWVDGHIISGMDKLLGRITACEQYADYLKDATIAFDDAQWMPRDIEAWLRRFGRRADSFSWYNPTGRTDRHVFLSFPDTPQGIAHRELVERCKVL